MNPEITAEVMLTTYFFKSQELLAVISLLVSGAVAEPPAPYAPSGWRPDGPAFVLPQRGQEQVNIKTLLIACS